MINELYTLWQSLQRCGIEIGEPHQNIKEPGKSEGFIIGVDQDCMPKTIEYISAENMHRLWTLRKGQHNSFPYTKLKKPIFNLKFDDPIYEKFKSRKTKLQEKTAALIQVAEKCQLSNGQNLNLAEWTRRQVAEIEGKDQKLSALVALVQRMPKNETSSENFLRSLSVLLVEALNEETIDLIKNILIGKQNAKEKKVECDASIFFDVSDWAKYLCRVARPEMGLLVSKYLPKASVEGKEDNKSAPDSSELHSGPYPDPNLPIIGRVYLFSMNEDAPCHNRYGKIGSTIYLQDTKKVQAEHGAIKWCIAEERKGKTDFLTRLKIND